MDTGAHTETLLVNTAELDPFSQTWTSSLSFSLLNVIKVICAAGLVDAARQPTLNGRLCNDQPFYFVFLALLHDIKYSGVKTGSSYTQEVHHHDT